MLTTLTHLLADPDPGTLTTACFPATVLLCLRLHISQAGICALYMQSQVSDC